MRGDPTKFHSFLMTHIATGRSWTMKFRKGHLAHIMPKHGVDAYDYDLPHPMTKAQALKLIKQWNKITAEGLSEVASLWLPGGQWPDVDECLEYYDRLYNSR